MNSDLGAKKIHKFLDKDEYLPDFFDMLKTAVDIYACKSAAPGPVGGRHELLLGVMDDRDDWIYDVQIADVNVDHWANGVRITKTYIYRGHFKVDFANRTIFDHTSLPIPPWTQQQPGIEFKQLMSYFFECPI